MLSRNNAERVLISRGWELCDLQTMSDALVDWIATGLADRYRPGTCGVFGADQGPHGPKTHSPIAEPEEPTTEEIARVANRTMPYTRHRRAAAIARQENLAVLVTEGRALAQREGMRETTLAALANIARLGAGDGRL